MKNCRNQTFTAVTIVNNRKDNFNFYHLTEVKHNHNQFYDVGWETPSRRCAGMTLKERNKDHCCRYSFALKFICK